MLDRWIDVHSHFYPPSVAAEREVRWRAMRAEMFLTPQPYEWTVEGTLDYIPVTDAVAMPVEIVVFSRAG